MTKTARREKNQEMAARMKAAGIERRTGRCPICYKLVNADYLNRGMSTHRCDNIKAK